jgi:ribonuclease-3
VHPIHESKTTEWGILPLQEALGYTFGDVSLLRLALTHTSYGHENAAQNAQARKDNERLEFLGDSVLSLVISDILLEVFPSATEGQLTKVRASAVNEGALALVARSLRLGECLLLGKGEAQSGGAEKPSILASAFEALIAAIYLDGGFNAVYPVVRHVFAPTFQDAASSPRCFRDPKTRLQELIQARHKSTPTYHLCSTSGPDHARRFEVEVRLGDQVLGKSEGASKKEAEQNAARCALELWESP